MVLNDWMILTIEFQGVRKELIMAYLKVLSLHLYLDHVRKTKTK